MFLLSVEELLLLVDEDELLRRKLAGFQSSSVGISIIERVEVSESSATGTAITLSTDSESLDSACPSESSCNCSFDDPVLSGVSIGESKFGSS